MDVLRTPDERFGSLPGFDWAPRYQDVDAGDGKIESLRVHYLDEGDANASETVLLMHGEPSWSYLYRTMIPILVDAGHRVVAPDLVGFGRSDKPAARSDYTYARHVEWMRSLLFDHLALSGVTLVCQDWGGLIGLRLVGEHPDRFRRVVAANTGLPTGDTPITDAFLAWQKFSQEAPELPVGRIVAGGCQLPMSEDVIAAYDAPFPAETYKEGARQFPVLVPTRPDDPASEANRRAWSGLERFTNPFLCAFSDGDPITRGSDRLFIERVPGATGIEHRTVNGGGHFLQEDKGDKLAEIVADLIRTTP